MKKIIIFTLCYFANIFCNCYSQNLSLDKLTELAITNSTEASLFKISKSIDRREMKSAIHTYKLKLDFSVQPSLTRSISPITQPDGSIVNHEVKNYALTPTINATMPIQLTGATLSLSSNFNYYKNKNGSYNYNSYYLNYFHINYSQNIQRYNNIKWGKKNAYASFNLNMYDDLTKFIEIKRKVTSLYLDLLQSQVSLNSLNEQMKSLDSLLIIYNKLYEHGKILEIELNDIKFKIIEIQENIGYYKLMTVNLAKEVNDFINIDTITASTILQTPKKLMIIDYNTALYYLEEQLEWYYKWARIPYESNIKETRSNKGVQVSFNTGIGLNSSSENLRDINKLKSPSINASINFKIPISDWKERENQYQIAILKNEQFITNFEARRKSDRNTLRNLIDIYNHHITNLNILDKKTDYIKEKIDIYTTLFANGKTSFKDYYSELSELMDNNKQQIELIKDIYDEYYKIEQLTMYDFINNSNYLSE